MLSTSMVRGKLNPLIEQWQRICILAERIIKRREAAAVRIPPAFRRTYLPTHFSVFSPSSSAASIAPSSSSIISGASNSLLPGSPIVNPGFTLRFRDLSTQGDLARLTNTLRAVIEVNEHCWRGDDCELSNGVRLGLEHVAAHTQRHSELSELRVRAVCLLYTVY